MLGANFWQRDIVLLEMNVGFVTMLVVMEPVAVSSLVKLVVHIARFNFHLITSYVHILFIVVSILLLVLKMSIHCAGQECS